MHKITVKGILSPKNGMNLYRGCQHGCIYCDSRSDCYQMHHSFEDIAVKENALVLLEQALRRKRKPCIIGTGSMTDPYIPLEKELRYTRRALQLICDYGFGATLLTKSDLVLRDLDLLQKINRQAKCVVQMTLTTYDEALCKKLEPNVCATYARFSALQALRDAGIPTVVWLCPILPFVNDTEENIRGILDYCAAAQVRGIICFGMGVTLRNGSRAYFYRQLDRLFPGMKEQYIRTFGQQYGLSSPQNDRLMALFHETCQRRGMLHDNDAIFQYLTSWEDKQAAAQMRLFGDGSHDQM